MAGAKPYASREEEEEARLGGAQRNLERWQERFGAFAGSVRMQRQSIGENGRSEVSKVHTVEIGEPPKPSGMTRLPRGTSLEDASKMFSERDRLKAAMPDADPAAITKAAIDAGMFASFPGSPKITVRVLKYPWLRWLYNAITKEVP